VKEEEEESEEEEEKKDESQKEKSDNTRGRNEGVIDAREVESPPGSPPPHQGMDEVRRALARARAPKAGGKPRFYEALRAVRKGWTFR